jgi:hypothetical protein
MALGGGGLAATGKGKGKDAGLEALPLDHVLMSDLLRVVIGTTPCSEASPPPSLWPAAALWSSKAGRARQQHEHNTHLHCHAAA